MEKKAKIKICTTCGSGIPPYSNICYACIGDKIQTKTSELKKIISKATKTVIKKKTKKPRRGKKKTAK